MVLSGKYTNISGMSEHTGLPGHGRSLTLGWRKRVFASLRERLPSDLARVPRGGHHSTAPTSLQPSAGGQLCHPWKSGAFPWHLSSLPRGFSHTPAHVFSLSRQTHLVCPASKCGGLSWGPLHQCPSPRVPPVRGLKPPIHSWPQILSPGCHSPLSLCQGTHGLCIPAGRAGAPRCSPH